MCAPFLCHLLRGPYESGRVYRADRQWHWQDHGLGTTATPHRSREQQAQILLRASVTENRELIQSSNWQRSQTTEKTGSHSQQAGHTTVGPLPPKVASKQPHPQPRLPPYLPQHRKLIVPSLLCPGRPPQSPLEMRHCPEATNWDVHKASVSRALCNPG